MTRTGKSFLQYGFFVIAVALLGMQTSIAAAGELRIGFIAPMTGPFAQVGKDMVNGFEMYMNEVKGDFAGATLKYLRRHPVARLTIAGGFAKLAKLAAGHLDLHSARSRVDMAALAMMLSELGVDASIAQAAEKAAGAAEILALAGGRREPLAAMVAARAREVALATLCGKTAVEVAIVDRQGGFLARVGG